MKKVYFAILSCIVAIILACGWFYYDNYMVIVKDYYLITIKDAEIKMDKLRNYANDSVAVANESADKESKLKSLSKEFDKALEEKADAKDETGRIMRNAKLNAIKSLMEQRYILISIEHAKSFDSEDFLEKIKSCGIYSDEVKEYINKNKVTTGIYPLN